MFTITIYLEKIVTPFAQFKTNYVPNIGDIYAKSLFEDNEQREVENKLCSINYPDSIIVNLKKTY